MEFATSDDVAHIQALDDFTNGVNEAVNETIKKNLTRFASEIANYTLNFLDAGLLSPTRATTTVLKATLTTILPSSLSSSSSSTISSILSSTATSLLSSAKESSVNFSTATSIADVTTATTTPTTLGSASTPSAFFALLNSTTIAAATATTTTTKSPLEDATTETAYATLANGIASIISPTIYSLNGQQTTAEATRIADDGIRQLEHAPQLSKSAMVKVYVLSVMAFLSLLGNIMTMWNIYKTRISRRNSRHSWSAIYSLIFHLSIADVLVTGFCIIGEATWSYTVEWLADEITCKIVKLLQMFSLYLSTYVLVLIGVDRWIAVKYPMKSLNMAKRCYRLLGGTYVLSLLLSLPQFFIFHIERGPFIEEFHQCVTHGFYSALWQEQLYATFTLVFTFLLPLCILFGTYLSSFRTIANSEKMFQGSKLTTYSSKPTTQTNRQRLIHKAKMKSLRISVVIIFAFLICWTPYYVMMIIFMFCDPDKRFGEDLQSAIFFFGMSNSLVNPLIYGAFHLCPMKRKASKYSNNNPTHSLNRGDSQRTQSMLTAVTQIDSHGRQVRTYRPSYYRTQSNGSNSNYKEHVSLLQVTPTPSIVRKGTTASFRCNGKTNLGSNSPHSTAVLLSYDGGSSTNSSINRCSDNSYCVKETLLGKHYTSGCNSGISDISLSPKDLHALVGKNENISSV